MGGIGTDRSLLPTSRASWMPLSVKGGSRVPVKLRRGWLGSALHKRASALRQGISHIGCVGFRLSMPNQDELRARTASVSGGDDAGLSNQGCRSSSAASLQFLRADGLHRARRPRQTCKKAIKRREVGERKKPTKCHVQKGLSSLDDATGGISLCMTYSMYSIIPPGLALRPSAPSPSTPSWSRPDLLPSRRGRIARPRC